MQKNYKIIFNPGMLTRRCLALFYIGFFCCSAPAFAEERVYKVEAAFLYNFLDYITWPPKNEGNSGVFSICVYGNDSLYNSLDYIKRKKIEERKLDIRRLENGKIASRCHIIFISKDYSGPAPPLQSLLGLEGALIISDIPGFLDKGGMIELTEEGQRMAISINNSLLSESGFSVSSRLLNIAAKVE